MSLRDTTPTNTFVGDPDMGSAFFPDAKFFSLYEHNPSEMSTNSHRVKSYRAGLQPFDILWAPKPGALPQAGMERAFSAFLPGIFLFVISERSGEIRFSTDSYSSRVPHPRNARVG